MSSQPKISVCLASYNGERFIVEQLQSILRQLSLNDELIVCDDGSQDSTINLIKSLNDERIIIHPFLSNVGHVKNFERALNFSTGDIIFLADQDDIWSEDKYLLVKECFSSNPEIHFVQHSLAVIDSNSSVLSFHWNPLKNGRQQRFFYLVRQIVKCQIFGCAIAFRRPLLDVLLPFPKCVYAHDHWIAIVAGIFGDVFFLNTPLVQYRHHDKNVTPRKGLGWYRKLLVRFYLVKLFFIALVRKHCI